MEMKAHYTSNGNIKLGNKMGVWSVLYGDQDHYVEKLGISVKGTCGHHCDGCKKKCYVKKSYDRYPSVVFGHARNTIVMRNDIEKCFRDLDGQLSRKRIPFEFIRIDQSGEVESAEQFDMHCRLAWRHPESKPYIYTKAFDIVIPALLAGKVPEYMTVLISIWHEYGIKEYNMVKHLPNVKAFVYDDGFDYSKYGLDITDRCYAYDENGKLDHRITCDKCQKCMNRMAKSKVIACYDH